MKHYTATVRRVVKVRDDIHVLYFTADRTLFYVPGQYITIFFEHSSCSAGKAYSLSSAPYQRYLSIAVKRVGEFSTLLCNLRVGDTFVCSDAYGHFNMQTTRPIVALGAGVGIAPIWSILKDEFHRTPGRVARLYCSSATHHSLPHYGEVRGLARRCMTLSVTYFITQQHSTALPTKRGRMRVDRSMLSYGNDAAYLVCGPVGFVRDTWNELMRNGIATTSISTEVFFE